MSPIWARENVGEPFQRLLFSLNDTFNHWSLLKILWSLLDVLESVLQHLLVSVWDFLLSRGCLWSKLIVSVSLEYLWYQSTTPNFHDAPISISGRAMLSVRRSTLIRGYFTFLYVLNTYVYVLLSSICGLEPRYSTRWLHREFQLPGSWCVVKYAPYHPIMPFFFSDSSFYKML
jgi:hypothetical protein